MEHVEPSYVFRWAASYDDVEEEEGMMDDGDGGDDDVDKLHQELAISLMDVNERVEACVLAPALFRHTLCRGVEEDHPYTVLLDIFV